MSDELEEKFTPGPWWFSTGMFGGRQFLTPCDDPLHIIAEFSPVKKTGDEERANGDLIRSSPELLRALKSLLSDEHARDLSIFYSDGHGPDDMCWTCQEKEEASARIADREDAAWEAVRAAHGIMGEEEEE